MRYVYLLESTPHPGQRYVGITSDFRVRLTEHNAGKSPPARKYAPWKPVVVLQCEADEKAATFERYLNQGSGHAFAKRHFWQAASRMLFPPPDRASPPEANRTVPAFGRRRNGTSWSR